MWEKVKNVCKCHVFTVTGSTEMYENEMNVAQQTKTEFKTTNANETTSHGRVELNNEHNQTSKQFTTQSPRHRYM